MLDIQQEMSATVNNFILRRVNTLNAEHLPPKLVQVVCCNLTEIQENMYSHLCNSKDMQHVLDGKQVNCLGSIQMLMKVRCHGSFSHFFALGLSSPSNYHHNAASSSCVITPASWLTRIRPTLLNVRAGERKRKFAMRKKRKVLLLQERT